MLIDEGLDTGPILLARATPIGAEETTPELEARLARLGGAVLLETLDGLARGTLIARAPGPRRARRCAPMLRKEDGRIDWSRAGGGDRAARARPSSRGRGRSPRIGGRRR